MYKKYEELRESDRVRDTCFVVHVYLFRTVGIWVSGYVWVILNVCYSYLLGVQFKSRLKNRVKVIGLETHALWCTCTYFAELGYGFLDMSVES